MARRYRAEKFIAYFQSFSNTYAPVERLQALYEEALGVEGVVGLFIGTRPDCVPEPVLDLLQEMARRCLVWVEYGLQSARDATLAVINRGHDTACFLRALEATHRRGIQVCAHIILGLPGETAADARFTAQTLAAAGVDGVKLHNLYVSRARGWKPCSAPAAIAASNGRNTWTRSWTCSNACLPTPSSSA